MVERQQHAIRARCRPVDGFRQPGQPQAFPAAVVTLSLVAAVDHVA
ncbi:hypothetical protein ACWD4J_43065 [Streptomyces sp. NPDC002577]